MPFFSPQQKNLQLQRFLFILLVQHKGTMKDVSSIPPYFGKHQRTVAKSYYALLYFIFYFCPIHLFIAIITLDYNVMGFYALVIVLQRLIKKNKKYIYFLNNVIQIRTAFKGFDLRYEEVIDSEQKCLFGFHPHGVLSSSILSFMNYKEGPLSNMVTLSSRAMLTLPFVGVLLRLWGVESVNHKNMKKLMKHKHNIGLVPGGFQEATLTVSDELRIYIKERKGFVKYALEHNYTIYPVLSINEHKMFWTFRYFLKFRLWLNKFKLPAVYYFNPKSFWFPSTDTDYQAIVGRGIRGRVYNTGQTPTNQEINEAHARYIAQIVRIYEAHKEEIGTPLKIY